jgi:hypothetical protein
LLFCHIEINGTWTADLQALPTSGAGFGIDDETVRDRLRIGKVDGLSFLQASAEFSLHLYRTNLYASLAEGTPFGIDEPRLSNDGNTKTAPFSFNL